MAVRASVLRAMLEAGCSAEQIVQVAESHEWEDEERIAHKREQNRKRQRNHRARNAMSRDVTHVTRYECDTPSSLEVSPTPPSYNPSPPKENPPKGGQKKGGRIPENWEPSPEDASWAKAEYGASDADLRKLTEEFRDYWLAESGQRARKVDWSRTWRNRCRQVWDGRRKVTTKSSEPDWRQAAQSFAKFGIWPAWAPGPSPDQPGCRCPDEVLQEFGYRPTNLSSERMRA